MVNRFRGILGLAAAIVLVSFVTGCWTTKSPGTQIDDAAIKTAVKAKLTVERFSNIVNVDVNVTNGVVTLSGEVPNAQVAADAVRRGAHRRRSQVGQKQPPGEEPAQQLT